MFLTSVFRPNMSVYTDTHSWYRGVQIPWREIFVGPQCGASCHLMQFRTVRWLDFFGTLVCSCMCFIWVLISTLSTSLNNINWVVFVLNTDYVLCEVGAEVLYSTYITSVFRCLKINCDFFSVLSLSSSRLIFDWYIKLNEYRLRFLSIWTTQYWIYWIVVIVFCGLGAC